MWQAVKVLVIDDDERRRHDLKVILDFLGEPAVASGYREWQEVAARNSRGPQEFAAVIIADCYKQQSLKTRIQQLWEWDRGCPVILAGEHQDPDESWEPYLRHLIIGNLPLPPTYGTLLDILHRAQHYRNAVAAGNAHAHGGRPPHLFRSLVGSSRKIQDLRKIIESLADRDMTVLIAGESGTGKEVVARNLHYRSPRSKGPFVPVDCRAIPEELLEAELFGQAENTDAGTPPRGGRIQMAEGGTLFLNGVGDIPLDVQPKVLRLLQAGTYQRVGGSEIERADLRIVAASHHDLETMIQTGKFDEQLYFSLNAFTIETPALRDRTEDVPLLINEVVARLEGEKRGSIRFNSAAIMSLCRHPWPGNVRELANLVERMAITNPYGVIGVSDLPSKYRHLEAEEKERATVEELTTGYQPTMVSMADRALLPESGIDLKEYLSNLERNLIQQALADAGGVVARAADHLTIRRTTLVEKMRKYGLQR
ncbi:sigma-54-dependent Fis family transcriptional regulator [Proteobacteria bacterium 005FR1]|nr:sigma-54-dependent Fis family transcriptional regulator [Proteobacteria bacterium 005FR1]